MSRDPSDRPWPSEALLGTVGDGDERPAYRRHWRVLTPFQMLRACVFWAQVAVILATLSGRDLSLGSGRHDEMFRDVVFLLSSTTMDIGDILFMRTSPQGRVHDADILMPTSLGAVFPSVAVSQVWPHCAL